MTTFPELPGKDHTREFSMNNISGINVPVEEHQLHELLNILEDRHDIVFSEIEIVFVDESEIVQLNSTHLNRDYITDIISFNYNDPDIHFIEGTLYCCAQRIFEQSEEYDCPPQIEFFRVITHGLLHLIGYNDQTDLEKGIMTQLEDETLKLLNPDFN